MITLRPFKTDDAERLVQLANNVNVSRYLTYLFPFPYTQEDAEWWISTGSSQGGAVSRVVELNGEFVGGVGVTRLKAWKNHQAEIGYWLGEPFWGQGIATEALKQMTVHAFDTMNVKKLFAPVLKPNIASMRVLEKCGYEREGEFRMEVFKNGQFYDTVQYAKLAPQ